MTKTEIARFREKLVRLGGRLQGDLAQLSHEALQTTGGEASGGLSNAPLHLADMGTDQFEDEVTLGLLENEDQLQEEIAAAVARIDAGSFGKCENCQGDISKARLEAVPYARLCIQCARAREANES